MWISGRKGETGSGESYVSGKTKRKKELKREEGMSDERRTAGESRGEERGWREKSR